MRAAAAGLVLVCLLLAGLGGCGEVFTGRHDFTRTATIALGRQTTFLVESPVQLVVMGNRRSTDLVYELRGTMTASTSSAAITLADAVEVTTEEADDNAIRLIVEGTAPREGRIEGGLLRVWLPDDMDVGLVGLGGPVDVENVAGAVDVVSASHGRVTGSSGSVSVRVNSGNAVANLPIANGNPVLLATNAGDVQLALPSRPSVAISAQATGGTILIRHPGLPRHPGGDLPYGAVVNGGLSQVILTSNQGNVVIDPN